MGRTVIVIQLGIGVISLLTGAFIQNEWLLVVGAVLYLGAEIALKK